MPQAASDITFSGTVAPEQNSKERRKDELRVVNQRKSYEDPLPPAAVVLLDHRLRKSVPSTSMVVASMRFTLGRFAFSSAYFASVNCVRSLYGGSKRKGAMDRALAIARFAPSRISSRAF